MESFNCFKEFTQQTKRKSFCLRFNFSISRRRHFSQGAYSLEDFSEH